MRRRRGQKELPVLTSGMFIISQNSSRSSAGHTAPGAQILEFGSLLKKRLVLYGVKFEFTFLGWVSED